MKLVDPKTLKAERLQAREHTKHEYIDELAEAYARGDMLPPITVFTDGKASYLADGVHRVDGAIKAGKKIGVDERQGNRAEAIRHACGANIAHGLRRTNADKRRAVKLAIEAFPDLSSRAIAEMCCVSHHLVEEARTPKPVGRTPNCNKNTGKTRAGRDGKRYQSANNKPGKSTNKISGGTSFDVAQIEGAAKPTKNGRIVFDPKLFRVWDDAFGKLKRTTDNLKNAHAGQQHFDAIHQALNQAYEWREAWEQSLA